MLEVDANTLAATVSVGVAMSTDQNRDLAGLLMAADRSLYRAKANGRNRVEYARAGPEVRIESVKAGTRESRRRWRNGAYDREASATRITGQELRSRSAD